MKPDIMALQATPQHESAHRILLQEDPACREGVFIFVWQRPDSDFPEHDYRRDNWTAAKQYCQVRFAVEDADWNEVPDENIGAIGSMPLWFKAHRRKNPWTWFT